MEERVEIEDEFPHEVFGGTLETLDLSDNKLAAVPSSVCRLTALEELNLSGWVFVMMLQGNVDGHDFHSQEVRKDIRFLMNSKSIEGSTYYLGNEIEFYFIA